MLLRSRLCLLTLTLLAGTAHAQGDAGKGKDVFAEECAECHSLSEGRIKKGPPLFGVTGRKAATIEDFDYSDAMRHSGITWTPDQLDAYIANPHKHVAGGRMKYDGLDDPSARADLIAFLATRR